MEQKQIQIQIFKDGKVKSRTKNIKGKACMKYMKIIEEITASRAIDSEFTEEYYEVEQKLSSTQTENEEIETSQYIKEIN